MSSHDPFALFGLERRTATERDVKKAYAAKLKQIRPEDDREGFMALRAAFEHARSMARWRDQYPEEAAEDDAYEDGTYVEPESVEANYDDQDATHASTVIAATDLIERQNVRDDHDFSPAEIDVTPIAVPPQNDAEWETHSNDSLKDPVDLAMDDIDALMKQPFAGGSMQPWQTILDRDDLQTIDGYQHLSQRLRWRLCTDTGFGEDPQVLKVPAWLTMPVFKGLCEHFGWHKQQSREHWVMQQQNWLRTIDTYLTSGKTVLPDTGFQQSHSPQQQTQTKSGWRVALRYIWIAVVILFFARFLFTDNSSSDFRNSPEYRESIERILNQSRDDESNISPETQAIVDRVNRNRALSRENGDTPPNAEQTLENLLKDVRKQREAEAPETGDPDAP